MRRIMQPTVLALATLLLAACGAAQTGSAVQAPPKSRPLPPTAMPSVPAEPAVVRPAVDGVPELDRSCRVDSDCAVKDVGNCCGYFPACVNQDARPDPQAVQAACAETGMAGVCGFRDIQACACVSNTCEPAESGGALVR